MSARNGDTAQVRTPTDVPDFATGVGGVSVGVGLGVLGGVIVALAPLLGVVSAPSGPALGAQPAAAVLTGVLAIGAPLLALVLLRGGSVLGAVGVLSGWAAAAVAAAVSDLQLFTRPIDANRFELFRPTSAAVLHAGAGAVAVLVGHVFAVLAGVVALWTMRRSALLDDPEGFDIGLLGGGDVGSRGTSLAGKAGRLVTALVGGSAVVAAAALFAPPLSSTDPVVLVGAVVEEPIPLLVGAALLMTAVLVVTALSLVSTSVPTGAGAVAGVALGALGVFGPRLVSSALIDRIGIGVGSVLGTVAAVVLLVCAAPLARSSRRSPGRPSADRAETEVRLPGVARMHLLTAVTGLLAGVAAMAAALLPVLTIPAGVPQPQVYSERVLLLAGVLLAAVCAGMLTGGFSALLRPVVAVAWVAPLLGASGVLQAVLVASSVSGVGAGAGAWVAALAVLLAAVCGITAGLAGAVERDDVDTSKEVTANRAVLVLAAVSAAAALLGLAFPLYTGSGSTAAALFARSWGWDSWGLAVVAVALLGAVLVAVRARPLRGVALLGGVELVLAVHLASWPLTSVRLVNDTAGLGVGFTLVALLAVPTTAVLLLRRRTP
ncbi:MAG: hypothetical protein ACXVXJ_06400 [Mycobacteriaceae bacterium]